MRQFQQIGIIRKLDDAYNPLVNEYIESITTYCRLNMIPCYDYSNPKLIYNTTVLLVAIGGDGTMLYAARESLRFEQAYVLGLSAGNLGFLTDQFSDSQLHELLSSIGAEDNQLSKLDKRMVIETKLPNNQIVISMNEILMIPDASHAPINYDIRVNDQLLASQSGSGIMVSTPTGSTAYSLSAGGAVVNPTASVMQVVPVAAHSLTSRPVVLSGDRDEVTIIAHPNKRCGIVVQSDGRIVDRADGDEEYIIRVKRHERLVKIVRAYNWSFFDTLSSKLGWK